MLKISAAQIPARIGDFAYNTGYILRAAANGQQQGAHIVITPELSLTGYIPEDLLMRPAYRAACEKAYNDLCEALTQYPDLYVLIGLPTWFEEGVKLRSYNSVAIVLGGVEVQRVHKQKLPNQAVFDELRYFAVGSVPELIEIQGVSIGVLVCEDAWHSAPALALKDKGAQLLLVPNASPFHVNKMEKRYAVLRARAKETGLPMLYVNRTGAQDELVFDGGSLALNGDGELRMQLPLFTDILEEVIFDINKQVFHKDMQIHMPSAEEQIYRTLVMGVKEYVAATGFKRVVLGLSGGVDSALTLAVAVDALGADNVHAIMMPTRYTAQMSLDDAQEMARRVGVQYDVVAIEDMFNLYVNMLAPVFGDKPADVTEENLQARIRGVILMAVSNKHGALVLNTGNKSELATGYCTLYGDMVGAFAVLKDVYKTVVYQVCEWRNASDQYDVRDPIPSNIITRAPSAELRDNQKDQDSLPPYEVLDDILERYIEQRQAIKTIVAAGHDEATVKRIARLVRINEYKRRQGALGPRVTTLAFGKDWRMPIMNNFNE